MEPGTSDKKGRRKRKSSENSAEEKPKKLLPRAEKERLERLVLVDASYMLRNLGVVDNDSGVEDGYTSDSPSLQPAWADDDDDQGIKADVDTSREKKCRKHFTDVFGQPSWAKIKKDSPGEVDEDMAVLRSAGHYLTKSSHLPKGTLTIKRLASLNSETRNEGPVIKCVEFHPTSTVALVAGLSGVASIFQVDGRCNKKLASVSFDKFPIRCGHFTTDGKSFIVGSQHHSFFYVYDMIEGVALKVPAHHKTEMTNMKNFQVSPDGQLLAVVGRFGVVFLLSANSREWIGNLQHNANVTVITFSPSGSHLYSHTETGEIYVWEMSSRAAVLRFQDDGTLVGTAMSVSEDYLATGSSWGVVNLYQRPELGSASGSGSSSAATSPPKPVKVFKNLVTPITSLKFNPTQEILAMASDEKDNAVKMAHLPSMQVFCNFPSVNSNLWRVNTLDFSPGSGYFSCGNSRSSAFLYRLPHFTSY